MSESSIQSLVQKYLSEAEIFQLATSKGAQPWICNLHFIADEQSNVYWISKTTRRHSEEIASNPNAAITIAVKTDRPLIGLQAEGTAEIVTDTAHVGTIMDTYMQRHGTDKAFVDTIVDGTNEHKLYAFHPKHFSLFDQVNFSDQPSQEWTVDRK